MDKTKVKTFSITVLLIIAIVVILSTVLPKVNPPKDLNIYLNEETRFADEIFIKVVGLSVDENQEELGSTDLDGDELSG